MALELRGKKIVILRMEMWTFAHPYWDRKRMLIFGLTEVAAPKSIFPSQYTDDTDDLMVAQALVKFAPIV